MTGRYRNNMKNSWLCFLQNPLPVQIFFKAPEDSVSAPTCALNL